MQGRVSEDLGVAEGVCVGGGLHNVFLAFYVMRGSLRPKHSPNDLTRISEAPAA